MQYQRRKVKSRGHGTHRRRRRPAWVMLVADVLIAGIGLVAFAYFHHVNPIGVKDQEPVALPETTPIVETTPEPQVTPSPEPEQEGLFLKAGEAPVITDTTLVTEHVNVKVETVKSGANTCHIAEIYVSDAKYLKTEVASGDYAGSWDGRDYVYNIGKSVNAFVAINGDQMKAHKTGIVVRNGVLYRDSIFEDVCVLEYDGTLKTYRANEFDVEALKANGAWQAWSFGPELMRDGAPIVEFTSEVRGANPRSAIGMIEPNHFLLVSVDGRGDSPGMTLTELAAFMAERGCVTAYNLDGGDTSMMTLKGEVYSSPSGDRKATDIIYVAAE